MQTTHTARLPAGRFLSGGLDQILGEMLLVLWVIWAFRANETAPVLTPQVCLGIGFIGFFTVLLLRPRGSIGSVRISIAVMLYLGLWIMSMLWSWDFWVWFAEARVAIALIGVGMMLGGVLERDRIRRGLLSGTYVAMAMTIAFSASGRTDIDGAWLGGFAHKNLMGGFFALAVLVILVLEPRLTLRIGGAATALALVLLSQSATGLLMVGAAVATIVIMSRVAALPPREAAAYFFSVATFIVFVLGFVAFQSANVVSGLGRDGSLSGRTELWPAVWDKIGEQPWVGWGPGLWIQQNADPARSIAAETGFNVGHSHNTFLEVLLLWGVLGLVIYAGVVIAAVRSGWRIVRIDTMFATMTLGFVAVMFVQSMSEPALGGWIGALALFQVLGQRVFDERNDADVQSSVDDLDLERLLR